ncbi:glutathione-disulfide reductase [Rickettsiales bacterium]|nr:glutathione-disulfide reductase [Rickettsiales bacterium]
MIFDFFVIGGGSGGVRASRLAALEGLKVGLAEGWDLGGTCVNRGCIPKKLYSYASHFNEEVEIMNSFGWSINQPIFDWKVLVKNKKKELIRLNGIYENLLKNAGVKVFNSWASFVDKNTIKLSDGNIIKSKKFLIAVGGEPLIPKIKGYNYIITSDEAFDLECLPNSILIMGGGYIAVEFASIFNGLGVDTTICVRGDRVLRGFDQECVDFLVNEMKKKGVKFIFNNSPSSVSCCENTSVEEYEVQFKNKVKKFSKVMAAIGRKPKSKKLKIENASIDLSTNGSIVVDDFFQTSNKNIFAIGDVIDRLQLTPVAINEAVNLIRNLTKKVNHHFNYKNIPTAIFSNPNMATIGISEESALEKHKEIDVYVSEFRPLKLTLSKSNEKVFIKLIVDRKTEKVIGLHYIGSDAAEIVQGFSVAIVKGLKKSDFDNTIGIHPSSAEEIVTLREKRNKL